MFEHQDLIPIEKKIITFVFETTDPIHIESNMILSEPVLLKKEESITIINIKENERKRTGTSGRSERNRQLF